jgi:hypothetical protein
MRGLTLKIKQYNGQSIVLASRLGLLWLAIVLFDLQVKSSHDWPLYCLIFKVRPLMIGHMRGLPLKIKQYNGQSLEALPWRSNNTMANHERPYLEDQTIQWPIIRGLTLKIKQYNGQSWEALPWRYWPLYCLIFKVRPLMIGHCIVWSSR